MTYEETHKEIERTVKIEFRCGANKVPEDVRMAYLLGWLDAEKISGCKADPDQFHTLVCDCGHRKDRHIPNKIRQDAGYAVCLTNDCKCNKTW
jgi:hypothetical protein